ncbi:MAG: chemotaxis protein CheC [Anaerovoracaceae bacterium]
MSVTDYLKLNEIQLSALGEIGNIGSGNAATALSSMLDKPVEIEIPKVEILNFDDCMNLVGGPEEIVSAVLVTLSRDINGMMLFIQQEEFLDSMLTVMLGSGIGSFEEIDEMGVSAVKEMGNIMLSAYVNAISQMTGLTIEISIPSHTINMAGGVLSVPAVQMAEETDYLLLIHGNFVIDEKKVKSNIFLVPDMESLNIILDNLGVNFDE